MWQKCPVCNGTGSVTMFAGEISVKSVCPTCEGHRIIHEGTARPPTRGLKTISTNEIYTGETTKQTKYPKQDLCENE